jgi:hypothetical protein
MRRASGRARLARRRGRPRVWRIGLRSSARSIVSTPTPGRFSSSITSTDAGFRRSLRSWVSQSAQPSRDCSLRDARSSGHWSANGDRLWATDNAANRRRHPRNARAAAGPRASVRLDRALRLAPRLSLVASTVAAVLVASALIAVPLFNRPTGSGAPSGLADASGATGLPSDVGLSSAPTSSARLLTPAEVAELARTRSRELSTKVAAVRGRLALDVPGCSTCANATFAGGDFGVRVRIVGSLRTSWGASSARTSAWVIRFTPEVENGLPIVEALGELRTGMSGGLTSTVIELLYDEVGAVGSYAAVDGWLVRTPVHTCASFVMPSDAPSDLPSYGCPEDDYLTDTEFRPTRADGSSIGPAKGILLPTESYAKWAPDPTVLGPGVEPRRATFLLELVHTSACGPTDNCLAGPLIRRWQIAARLEPIPNLEAAPTPEPEASSLPVVGDTYPGGIPRSVGGEPVLIGLDSKQRIAGATDASSFLIGGLFGGGPVICGGTIGPRDPNPLAYHGCAMYEITGVPGVPYYPPTLVMPPPGSDGPIVLRVHVNDPGAETCWDVAACRARLVIDDVVWLGDASTSAGPIGPTAAITQALRVEFADVRIQPDKSQAYVDEDRFALPITCAAPIPELTFQLRGDPRMALLAVFPDSGTRESVQATVDPSVALGCLPDLINRVGEPRWIGRDNVLLLVVADEKTAGELSRDDPRLSRRPRGWGAGSRDRLSLDRAAAGRLRRLRGVAVRHPATPYGGRCRRDDHPAQRGRNGGRRWRGALAGATRRCSPLALPC